MSLKASSTLLSGSMPPRWERLASCAALPPAAAPDEPPRLFDLNKAAAGADDCSDEASAEAAVAAAASEQTIQRVTGEGRMGKFEVMACMGRGGPELAPSSLAGDREDTEDELSESAWDSGAWAASRKLQPPTTSLSPYACAVQRTNATSLPVKLKEACAATAAAATAAAATAASAAPPPAAAAAAAATYLTPAAAAAPATFTKTTATVATTGATRGTALTSAAGKRMGLMVSGGALTAAVEDSTRLSPWCEATVDEKIAAAPSTAAAARSTAAVSIHRNIASTSPNSCAVGRDQSQASTAAALLAISSATAATAAASEGSPNSVAADASSDSLRHRLLRPAKCAGAGACSNPEAQGHALSRARYCASQHLLQRDRISSILRCTAAALTNSNATKFGCVAGTAPHTTSAELPYIATPSFLPGNGLCYSVDPPSTTFQGQRPTVPLALMSRASQKRKDHEEVFAMFHSKAENFSLPLVQANSCGDAAKVLKHGGAPKDGGRPGCTDPLRRHCPTDSIDGYRCRECGKVFTSAQALGGHTASHVRLRRSNFRFGLGHYPQNQPLIESSRSIRTEPVATPGCYATTDKDIAHSARISGLLYGSSGCFTAPDTSKGSSAPTIPIKVVRRNGVETSSSWLTADVSYFPAASSRLCHENRDAFPAPCSGTSSQDSRSRPSAQRAAHQEGSRVQKRNCLQTSANISEGIGMQCWQRLSLTENSAAAATETSIAADATTIAIPNAYHMMPHPHSMKERASCSASAIEPCDPDSCAAISSIAFPPAASMAEAVGPLTPSALTAAARAFMDQHDGDGKRPSKHRRRAKSSSTASAATWEHSGRPTCKCHAGLGAGAMHGLAHKVQSRSSCHFRPASQTVLPLVGIHQLCLTGFLGCNSRQLVINSAESQMPTQEGRDKTPGLDLNLEL